MRHRCQPSSHPLFRRLLVPATVVSTLALGACAGVQNPFDSASVSSVSTSSTAQASSAVPQSDLQKATEYWGKQHEKDPRDPQAAINYIRNLKALGAKQQALAVAQGAFGANPQHKQLASEYGRLALDLEQLALADKLLALADDPVQPDWKVVSARGTVLAKQGKYREAIPLYERANALAPNQPAVLNNLALAHAMNGQADKAEPMLRQAANDQSADPKVSRNLSLVLGLQGKHEDAKSVIVRDAPTEESAEDSSFVKQMVGNPAATAAPMTTSISTSSTAPMKAKPAAGAKSSAKTQPIKAVAAPAEDASVLVERLANAHKATPESAPIELLPKR
jgi:Flp pilus assembly protein TadD